MSSWRWRFSKNNVRRANTHRQFPRLSQPVTDVLRRSGSANHVGRLGVGRYVLASHSLDGAAPTGRNRDCRRCRLAARSWLRSPTADSARRERSLRSYSSAPASTRRGSRRHMPQRPMHQGSPNAIGSLGGKSTRGIGSGRVPASPCGGVLRRRSAARLRSRTSFRRATARRAVASAEAAEARPVAAHARHCPLSETVVPQSMITMPGLPVTQCRPWPAEDVWSEPRAAPARYTGAGKWAERFHAASSRPAIRARLTTPRASAASHLSSNRIPYSARARAQREYQRRPFSGLRKSASDGQGRRCVGSRTAARDSAGAPRGHPVIRYVGVIPL